MCVAYEGIILFGVIFFFGYGFSALTQFKGNSGVLRYAFQIFMFGVLTVYFVWFWTSGRRTLPMKTMQVQLVDKAGAPVTARRAGARFILACTGWAVGLLLAAQVHPLGLLVALLPFSWALFDAQHRTLYDVLSGTRLVSEPAERRGTPAGGAGLNG